MKWFSEAFLIIYLLFCLKQSSTSNFLDFPFPVISKKTKQNPILFFSSILHDIPIRSFQMIVCILISDFWHLSDSYDINFLLPNKSGKFISQKKEISDMISAFYVGTKWFQRKMRGIVSL